MFDHSAPLCQVIVDGKEISTLLNKKLVGLTITDANGLEADTLDLTLDDSQGDIDIPPRGATIKVMLGWPDTGVIDKGTYTVDELEHSGAPDILTIRARSADLREGLTQKKERSWRDVKLGDIVRKIADENSYDPVIGKEFDEIERAHLDQQYQSDADLLTRLAEQYDAICTVKSGKLLFIKAGTGATASGINLPVANIVRKSGDRHRFTIRDRDNYVAVMASYYDTNAGKKGEVTYDGKSAQQAAQAEASGIRTLTSTYKSKKTATTAVKKAWKRFTGMGEHPSLVQARYDDKTGASGYVTYNGKVIGEKKLEERRSIPPVEASADNIKKLRHVYTSKANAERAVKSEYDRLQRGRATFNQTLAKGDPNLFPAQPVLVSGFKPAIDGSNWVMTRVIHKVDPNSGYTTDIEAELLNNQPAENADQ